MFQAGRRKEPSRQTESQRNFVLISMQSSYQEEWIEVPFWGLSYRLSIVRPGSAIEGAETGSQVCDKWRVNESHKFLDKYLTHRVTRGQGSVICLSCCGLPGGFLGVGRTAALVLTALL